MNIAVLGTRGFPDVQGGVETHCENLYPTLVKAGINITVFARKGYVQNSDYKYKGVKIRPLWSPQKKNIEAIVHTFLGIAFIFFKRKHFDILHIHSIGPSLLVPFARIIGLKVVVTNHGADYHRKKWGRAASTALKIGERLGSKYGSQVIAVSKHIKNHLETEYGYACTYIPNGVQVQKSYAASCIQKKHSLSKRRYILAVGRLVPEKGFHDLIEAFNSSNPTAWKLVIAGGADHDDDYSRELLASAAKNRNIVMAGKLNLDEVGQLYSNAGVFILPSYHEGLPLVILEAMSFGLPLIVSDIEANKELIENMGDTFPVGDVDALAKKMNVYTNSNLPGVLNKKLIERVEKHFNWGEIAERTLDVYDQVIKGKNRSYLKK